MVDFHEIALLSPVFIAFVFLLQIINANRLKKELPYKLLFLFFINVIAFSIPMLNFKSENYEILRYSYGFFFLGMLLLHPLVYLYIKAIIQNKLRLIDYILNLAPAVVMFLSSSTYLYFLDRSEVIIYFRDVLFGAEPEISSSHVLFNFLKVTRYIHGMQAITYFILIFSLLRKHRIEIEQIFTQANMFRLNWLFSFNIFYSLISVIGIFSNMLPTQILLDYDINDFVMINISLFALFIGIKGLNQVSIGYKIDQLDKEVEVENTDSHTFSYEHLLVKINNYIVRDKEFLNPELKVWDIVKVTGINRTYISKAINTAYNTSFSQYVNKLRVDEACQLIKLDSGKSFETIAFESGFNSISTFNRAIKKFKGVSPSEMRFL